MGNRAKVTAAATLLGIAVLVASSCDRPAAVQPVAYPHAKHLALGMDCEACHTGAIHGTHAGIPKTALCATCHVKDRAYPPTPPAMAAHIEAKTEIPWIQLNKVPRHVYFSHQRHAGVARLDCAECHGDMKTRLEPVTQPTILNKLPGMANCTDCHKQKNVTTDCISCHR